MGKKVSLPPSSNIFPVPKSVIFIRRSPSKRRFSGLRSLQVTSMVRVQGTRIVVEYPPMYDVFVMHILESVNYLCCVIS